MWCVDCWLLVGCTLAGVFLFTFRMRCKVLVGAARAGARRPEGLAGTRVLRQGAGEGWLTRAAAGDPNGQLLDGEENTPLG